MSVMEAIPIVMTLYLFSKEEDKPNVAVLSNNDVQQVLFLKHPNFFQ